LWFPVSNIIDDVGGIALYNSCDQEVLQFISYNGSFTANDGVAQNLVSEDILVFEDENTSVGESLQLIGVGQNYADFDWVGPILATAGQTNILPSNNSLMNTYQFFGSDPGPIIYCNQQDLILTESDTTITVEIGINNLTQITEATLYVFNSSSANETVDLEISEYTYTFDDLSQANQILTFDVTIIDDTEIESTEYIKFAINSNEITVPHEVTFTILDNDVTSIEDVENNYNIKTIQTQNQLIFKANQLIEYVALFNSNGQIIVESITSEINIANYNKGVYFAVLTINGKMVSKKLLLE